MNNSSVDDLLKIINDCQVFIQLMLNNDCAEDVLKEVLKFKKQVKDLSCFSLNIKGKDLTERLEAIKCIASRLNVMYHDVIMID